MGAGLKKEIKSIIQQLEAQGWRVQMTNGGHWKAYAPDGKGIAHFAGSPSSYTAITNCKAHLRRLGAKIK